MFKEFIIATSIYILVHKLSTSTMNASRIYNKPVDINPARQTKPYLLSKGYSNDPYEINLRRYAEIPGKDTVSFLINKNMPLAEDPSFYTGPNISTSRLEFSPFYINNRIPFNKVHYETDSNKGFSNPLK